MEISGVAACLHLYNPLSDITTFSKVRVEVFSIRGFQALFNSSSDILEQSNLSPQA